MWSKQQHTKRGEQTALTVRATTKKNTAPTTDSAPIAVLSLKTAERSPPNPVLGAVTSPPPVVFVLFDGAAVVLTTAAIPRFFGRSAGRAHPWTHYVVMSSAGTVRDVRNLENVCVGRKTRAPLEWRAVPQGTWLGHALHVHVPPPTASVPRQSRDLGCCVPAGA